MDDAAWGLVLFALVGLAIYAFLGWILWSGPRAHAKEVRARTDGIPCPTCGGRATYRLARPWKLLWALPPLGVAPLLPSPWGWVSAGALLAVGGLLVAVHKDWRCVDCGARWNGPAHVQPTL